jgi:hypothetical protein
VGKASIRRKERGRRGMRFVPSLPFHHSYSTST